MAELEYTDNITEKEISNDEIFNEDAPVLSYDALDEIGAVVTESEIVSPKKRINFVTIIAIAIVIIGGIFAINKLNSYKAYFANKSVLETLIYEEDVDGLVNFIDIDETGVLGKNSELCEQVYAIILNSARIEMKEGSLSEAYKLLKALPSDYSNVPELTEKVEFYLRFNKKYSHAYSPYKLTLKINIDPDSKDVYVDCNEQPLLNTTIPYKATKIRKNEKSYSISFDMETGDYEWIVNHHISTRSGKYNH